MNQGAEAIQTVTSSPRSDVSHPKLQKEIISPVAVTPVSSNDTTKDAVKQDARTAKQERAEGLQLLALFWSVFYVGCNDGSVGPLLPRIQQVYSVGFTVVSLILIGHCIGFILGSLANFYLAPRFGFGKTVILGSVCQIIACSAQAPGPPFPVFVIAYALNGLGTSLQLTQGMSLIVCIKRDNDIKMGFYHAFYGLGALSAPFASTQFAQMRYWNLYYLIALGMAVLNLISLSVVFGFKTLNGDFRIIISHSLTQQIAPDCLKLIGDEVGNKSTSERSTLSQVLPTKVVHYLGFVFFFYTGAQVGLSLPPSMREEGVKSSGYVSTGFFAGLMLGRVVLLWVNRKFGVRVAMFSYIFLAIGLVLVVWLVLSLVGGAVAACFVGLFLGPMYPFAMIHGVLPESFIPNSIAWITGFGITGSAAFPFLTGAISSKYGIETLHPLVIAMLGCMSLFWYLVPAKKQD